MSEGRRAAIVLAAGASTRLGRPKQLELASTGENLLERTARVAHEAGCSPVVVVLGASAEPIRAQCSLGQSTIVINPEWREGMSTSIVAGVRCVRDAAGVVLLTCDMPSVTAEHLRALGATGDLTVSRYGGRNGVPAFFPPTMFGALLALRGDAGARDLIQTAPSVQLAGGDLDIDTPADLNRMRTLLAPGSESRKNTRGRQYLA